MSRQDVANFSRLVCAEAAQSSRSFEAMHFIRDSLDGAGPDTKLDRRLGSALRGAACSKTQKCLELGAPSPLR
jgi:hypothetical protein